MSLEDVIKAEFVVYDPTLEPGPAAQVDSRFVSVALMNGGFAVGYVVQGYGSSFGQIRVDIYDALGVPTGAHISLGATTQASNLSIAASPDGTLAVVWSQPDNTLRGQVFDYSGSAVTSAQLLASNIAQNYAATIDHVEALAGGGFALTWLNQNGYSLASLNSTLGQVWTKTGLPMAFGANITVLANGDIVFASVGEDGRTYSDQLPVYVLHGNIYTASGEIRSTFSYDLQEIIIDYGGTLGRNLLSPAHVVMVGLENGGFAASWLMGSGHRSNHIQAHAFDAFGAPVGDLFDVTASSASQNQSPTLIRLPGGGFVAAWAETTDGDNSGDIWAQQFAGSGNLAGARFAIAASEDGEERPSLTTILSGRVVAVWAEQIPNEVYGRYAIHADILSGQQSELTGSVTGNVVHGTSFDDTIHGLGGDDLLFGGFGSDVLYGDDGNDVLDGGTANDTLVGGDGRDTFVGTASSLNGDTIVDLTSDDHVLFSGADLSSFHYSLTGSTLTYTGGQLTLQGMSGERLYASQTNNGVALSLVPQFTLPHFELAAFGHDPSAGGWNTPDRYPRAVGDVNGDGKADIIGMAEDGVFVALASGSGHYGAATFVLSGFGASVAAGGWNNDDRYPRMVADVNGDGRADIVGFGEDGGFTALGQADGTFGVPTYSLNGFGASTAAGGWNSQSKYTRMLGDVNGDGKADIVGFAEDGVFVALATSDGRFATPTFTFAGFGASAAAGSWNDQNKYPRMLADVNGDGKADILGFAEAGVFISLATGDGHFGVSTFRLAEFGSSNAAGGWTSQDLMPRFVADVNGDGKADIVGLGNDGVHISYGNGDGTFQNSVLDVQAFGHGSDAGGWSSQTSYPRYLADVNGDHTADIIGLAGSGVFVGLSHVDSWS